MERCGNWLCSLLTALLISSATCLPARGVISPDIKVVEVLERNGRVHYEVWSPTSEDLARGNQLIEKRKLEKENVPNLEDETLHADYIVADNDILNFAQMNLSTEYTEGVVELSIVCDMAFGAVFNFDRKKILEYWTAYMWEVNLSYKTLPSTYLSVIVTSVVIISTPGGQHFIEEARNEEGKITYNRIIGHFGDFMYKQIGVLPQFDVAMAVTNEPAEWYGGLAYVSQACRTAGTRFMGVFAMSDDGRRMSTMTVTSHEMAHVLGAPHDSSIEWCKANKYLMSGGNHFFSPCSDITINNYVRSNNGACIRNTTTLATPVLDPDYNNVPVMSIPQQCHKLWDNESAFVDVENLEGRCTGISCKIWKGSVLYARWFDAVSNTKCGENKHCFRGQCVLQGSLIVNSGSEECMKSADRFSFNNTVQMVPCPSKKAATPLDTFIHSEWKLSTPFSIQGDTVESDYKCLVRTGSYETGYELKFDRCSSELGKDSSWMLEDVGIGTDEVWLWNGNTQRIAKQEGSGIVLVAGCKITDASCRWRLE